ncbi:uncharacterized protein BO97DRAFT_423105 [Aspergillus homomorphus CBS 101889]|uniref:Arrestin C-terminal-like domain-containing protein n=1 Tax=Aspergillus homomorphus (strain CBS 101889) TaxID=1450537 RepID=A0A395I299_ASPHC|nr:hypothetical protein BO97DRAFT_423105 [Aspergillus homomorphus CBS 101889]RAL14190.1 hypothetical protein BO97DRAFT_423105 [Aspergillus homomorphus CBS 101889]
MVLYMHYSSGSDQVFLHPAGSLGEESPRIAGTLVMSLVQPTKIAAIEVQLKGVMKRKWGSLESVIYQSSWRLAEASMFQTLIYGPGRHEIPLNIALDLGEHMRETVEAVEGYSVTYLLTGRVLKRFTKDLTCRERIKIYRNPPLTGWESAFPPPSFENEWPGKIRYFLNLTSSWVPFGSHICPRLHLVPLADGLQVESIGIEVVETHGFAPISSYNGRFMRPVNRCRVVCEKWFSSAKDMAIATFDHDNGYEFSLLVPLPRSVLACAQDVQSSHFDITHKVVFTLRIINADGHISAVRASIPVAIHMYRVDVNQLRTSTLYARHIIPPVYGKHEEDTLVTDNDLIDRLSVLSSPLYTRCSSPSEMQPQRDGEWDNATSLSRTLGYDADIREAPFLVSNLPPPYIS